MQDNTEKLKKLLLSGDEANFELAYSLAESQANQEIIDLYFKLIEIHDFWSAHPMENFSDKPYGMIPALKMHGLNMFKNYEVKTIPKEHEILAPYIRSFYIWYTSLRSLPEGLGMFKNIEKIEVQGAPFTYIRDEIWELPLLREVNLTIGKNFQWEPNFTAAKNIETLELSGVVYPPVSSDLAKLPKLKTFAYRALGNPKDAIQLPSEIWDVVTLEELNLFGKTILCPMGANFEKLKSLKTLSIAYTNWDALPVSLQKANTLKSLTLSNLIKLKRLPDWFAGLPIENLKIEEAKIENALEIIKIMPNLKTLHISENLQKKVTKDEWVAALGHLKLSID